MTRMNWFYSLSFFFLASGSATAQTTVNQVITVKVRPGLEAQFEEFVHAFRDASREQGLENYWLASQAVSGEPSYTFNMPMSGWADLANPEPQLVEAFGEEEAARIGALAARSIESVHTAFYEPQPDMSVPPPQGSGPPVAVTYFDITLNPGMAQQYAEVSRKTKEASMAVTPDSYYLVAMPGFGASAVRVVGIIPSWSNLDTPFMAPGQRVIRHFGQEEGGRLVAMINEAISGIEASLNRTRPDLAYQPDN